jgi:hypothetical protein
MRSCRPASEPLRRFRALLGRFAPSFGAARRHGAARKPFAHSKRPRGRIGLASTVRPRPRTYDAHVALNASLVCKSCPRAIFGQRSRADRLGPTREDGPVSYLLTTSLNAKTTRRRVLCRRPCSYSHDGPNHGFIDGSRSLHSRLQSRIAPSARVATRRAN